MKITIAQILEEMKKIIEEGRIVSPQWWLDNALKLAVLRQDLQSEMIRAEVLYRNEVVELTEQKIPYNRAENMIKGRKIKEGEKMTSYQFYQYLRGRDQVVEEIIRIAKKRATVSEYET
jgi:hypothetical protein